MRITEFTSHLKYGGLRPALFQVIITNPITNKADGILPFRCEAASLPEASVNPVELRYFGRAAKFPGARQFGDWTVTIIEDEDYVVRDALEAWNTHINTLEGNRNALPTSEPSQYKSTGLVTLYSQTNVPLRSVKMLGMWPSTIEPLAVNWAEGDQIARYQVTFSYDYWVPELGQTDKVVL